ncbi:MAG: hypothetical protein ACKVP7_19960 [Hyphomicrobiaceae bacterium]
MTESTVATDVRATVDAATLHVLRLIDPEETLPGVEIWFAARPVVLATNPHLENHPRA